MTRYPKTAVIGARWTTLFLASGRDVAVFDPSPDGENAVRAYIDSVWPTLLDLGLAAPGRSGIRGPDNGRPFRSGQPDTGRSVSASRCPHHYFCDRATESHLSQGPSEFRHRPDDRIRCRRLGDHRSWRHQCRPNSAIRRLRRATKPGALRSRGRGRVISRSRGGVDRLPDSTRTRSAR